MRNPRQILIVGSSHVGAFQAAGSKIKTAFPQFDVTYFGLPGRSFAAARFEEGRLSAPEDQPRQFEWMERRDIGFAPFDHILFVGERFALFPTLRLLRYHDALEDPYLTERTPMSRAALTEFIAGMIRQRVEIFSARFGQDPRYCILPAPYPLNRSLAQGVPKQEQMLAAVLKKPMGQSWAEHYETALRKELTEAGFNHLLQPLETRAQILTTDDRFARPNTFETVPDDWTDHRHMNSAYGFELFCAYAKHHLGVAPETAENMM